MDEMAIETKVLEDAKFYLVIATSLRTMGD